MSKDMPGHARYRHANEGCTSNMDEAAELGWNHESIYSTRPFAGTGVFCVPLQKSQEQQ
ncbi:hypothetical protein Q0V21_27420 [Paenibacillus sp. 11B]|uniref:hypothetical protein n=1 Tax=Paenibacillus sp. 11B TaxID=3060965 RepID=UPI0015C4147D|nr:hypothetical protein [Paenibacillus sp. 11B]MDN8592457.1 hypothetical protein [Paenibacillus sp. 11B]